MVSSPETAIALNSSPDDAYLEELDQKVKSMMIVSENQIDKRHGQGTAPDFGDQMEEQEYAQCVARKARESISWTTLKPIT